MFYHFRQNNSFGIFQGPTNLIIEADTEDQAIEFAEKNYLMYFDGVSKKIDCSCCGDRWSRFASGKNEVPNYYGTPLDEAIDEWGNTNYKIFYKDGRTEEGEIKKVKRT